jgi:hypothetical protein
VFTEAFAVVVLVAQDEIFEARNGGQTA